MREMKKANDDYVENKKKPFRIGLEECKPGTQIIFKGTRQILNGTILQAKYNILFVELEENKAAEAEGLLNSDTNGNVLLKIPKDNIIEIKRRRKERTRFIVSSTTKSSPRLLTRVEKEKSVLYEILVLENYRLNDDILRKVEMRRPITLGRCHKIISQDLKRVQRIRQNGTMKK